MRIRDNTRVESPACISLIWVRGALPSSSSLQAGILTRRPYTNPSLSRGPARTGSNHLGKRSTPVKREPYSSCYLTAKREGTLLSQIQGPKKVFEDEAEVQGYCGLGPRVVPSVVEDKVKAQGYCSLGPWVVPNTIVDETKAHGHCNLGPWAIPSTTEYETKAQGRCNLGPWVVLSPWAIIGTVEDEAKAHTKGAEEPMRVVVDAPVTLGSQCWTSSSLWRAVSSFWSDCSTPCCMGSYPL
ncbi:hypothetical protein B296_00027979 [Ensete ventricosum]|uniref:Uncharacterized protein n=1 Tax=Ensete ventricosum TaxID=4639 RepID=A0A426ZSF6_ENSVE|nr:hypothetical protein B296_00027979 [Ensete ventricosum]